MYAAPHGILAASLVINRRLYKIASTSSVSITVADRRRAIYIDLAIGLGIPISSIALCKPIASLFLHAQLLIPFSVWFIQGHRFDIWEGYGPWYAVPNTYLQMVLGNGKSLVIGIISCCYCSKSAWHRKQTSILTRV